MVDNKILTKDDKKKLADFLFQCLSDGVSKERINDLAQTWIKKGGKVNNEECAATWDECRDKKLRGEKESTIIFGILLPLAFLVGLMAAVAKVVGRVEVAVTAIGIFVGLVAVAFLAFMGYSVNQHISNKKYASACAEEMVDAYNVKCFEAMQTRCQELESTAQNQQNLISEILNNQTSNLYPQLPLSNAQLQQYLPTAPSESLVY